MKKIALKIVLINFVIMVCGFTIFFYPPWGMIWLIEIFICLGILFFFFWSLGHGNYRLIDLVKALDQENGIVQLIWNFFKVFIGGVLFWHTLLNFLA